MSSDPSVRPSSQPGENRCRNCGSFVTRDFARVFGNNYNEVFGCLECMSATNVKRGGARSKDAEVPPLGGTGPVTGGEY